MFGEEFRRYVENDLMKREPHPDAKPLGAFQSAGALNRCCVEPLLTGKQLRRWDADKNGKPFEGGINDIVVTANGGAYATVFGPYADLPTSVVGKIVYLAPGGEKWVEVVDDLNYANGIGVSPDQKTL